ncbi:MAG: hypothetical protein L0Y74_03700 [candidate division Zixibacteria bacterium]|nr:hypothetical protein [candidate division Zixibacteria bacterium]
MQAFDSFTRDDLKGLIEYGQSPAVSIYMPTHHAGQQIRQDHIRLKNQLKKAQKLVGESLRPLPAKDMLKSAYELVQDSLFWEHQGDGLALFISPEWTRRFRLPLSFTELCLVTDRFHIKPLLPLFGYDDRFYLLVLNLNKLELFSGNRTSLAELPLENVPASLSDALRFDQFEKQLGFHTKTPSDPGGRAAIYYGQGSGRELNKEHIKQYFLQVERGVGEFLQNESAPLILAGVDYLNAIYREVNGYPHLLEENITGSREENRPEISELHAKAWSIAEPEFRKLMQPDFETYRQMEGKNKSSGTLREIVAAAFHKRIDRLFVASSVQVWGQFDSQDSRVTVHDRFMAGDCDLLDFSALHTLLNGGRVHVLEPNLVPSGTLQAAIFRY